MGRQCRLAAVQPRDPGAVDKMRPAHLTPGQAGCRDTRASGISEICQLPAQRTAGEPEQGEISQRREQQPQSTQPLIRMLSKGDLNHPGKLRGTEPVGEGAKDPPFRPTPPYNKQQTPFCAVFRAATVLSLQILQTPQVKSVADLNLFVFCIREAAVSEKFEPLHTLFPLPLSPSPSFPPLRQCPVIARVKIYPCLPFCSISFHLLSPPAPTHRSGRRHVSPPARRNGQSWGRGRGSGCSFTVCLTVGDPGPGMGRVGIVRVALGIQVVEEDVDFVRR